MEGISKATLREKFHELSSSNYCNPELLRLLNNIIDECKELNPWQPIETAPLKKKIRLFGAGAFGKRQIDDILHEEADKSFYTHFCELPDDPK